MTELDFKAYNKFKEKHKVGDVLSLNPAICKTLFETKFNDILMNCNIINVKIDYIGNYGFTGIIIGGINSEYLSKTVSISFKQFALNNL